MPSSLVGAFYLQPPDARAIFLHNDLLCNDTCSVARGSITYWGAQTEKIRFLFTCGNFTLIFYSFFDFLDRIFFEMVFPIHS